MDEFLNRSEQQEPETPSPAAESAETPAENPPKVPPVDEPVPNADPLAPASQNTLGSESTAATEQAGAPAAPVEEPPVQPNTAPNPYAQNQNPYAPTGSPYAQGGAFYPPRQTAYAPVGNPVVYSPVRPVQAKPASKGLKVFAVILAAVLLLTGASAAGYYVGKNNSGTTAHKSVSVNLAAKPKNTDEMTAAEVYDAVNNSVVGIVIYNTAGSMAQASGVFYTEDGYIVTNDHIYAEIPSAKFKIYTADGKEYDADYVAGDQISDIAILKIKSGSFHAASFGDSDQLFNGEHVVAVGRPADATDASVITGGIVSSTGKRVTGTTSYSIKMIQTDSAINPGSSGGALVNMYGQVVGITSSKLVGTNYDAVGYAIPTTMVKRVAEELISDGHVVSRAKLGITYTVIDSVTAEINDYDHVGLYVASVSEDSDLYGKVKEGDVITQINHMDITDDDMVLDIIQDSAAGDTITVTVYSSSGNTKTYDAVLKANIGESSYSNKAASGNAAKGGVDGSGSDKSGGTFDFPSGE